MKLSLLVLCLVSSSALIASNQDSTKTVQVNDSITIGECPKSGYVFVQYYQKTRFPNPDAQYNHATGDDFYEYFFLDGDFDVKPLPCNYANKAYRIISIRTLVDKKTGADRPVMFLELGSNTVAWVELNGAVENLEIFSY